MYDFQNFLNAAQAGNAANFQPIQPVNYNYPQKRVSLEQKPDEFVSSKTKVPDKKKLAILAGIAVAAGVAIGVASALLKKNPYRILKSI